MKKKKRHYYPHCRSDTDDTTACGRDGRKIGGFISFFFRQTKQSERCKVCNKQFEKEDAEGIPRQSRERDRR